MPATPSVHDPRSPDPPALDGPLPRGPRAVWTARSGGVHLRFTGRGPRSSREELLRAVETAPGGSGGPPPVAWVHQVHSGRVLEARGAGRVGEADAVWTRRPALAVSVVTADCVPVLLAATAVSGEGSGPAVAAVHAGWRGIEAGVVPRAVTALRTAVGAASVRMEAWIGPAIGACCYEVGDEVAERLAAAAGAEHVVPPPSAGGAKPHLDLPGAVRAQLAAAGVAAPRVLVRCTRCDGATLASYRRDGERAGRNVSFAWMT